MEGNGFLLFTCIEMKCEQIIKFNAQCVRCEYLLVVILLHFCLIHLPSKGLPYVLIIRGNFDLVQNIRGNIQKSK